METENQEQIYIVPDRGVEDQWGGYLAEQTMEIRITPGFASCGIRLLGPRGGVRDEFRASADWLDQAAQSMIMVAAMMRRDDS